VFVADVPDARVIKGFDDAGRFVGRGVVDDDEFEVLVGLVEDAGD
jgi:hypothetical protein